MRDKLRPPNADNLNPRDGFREADPKSAQPLSLNMKREIPTPDIPILGNLSLRENLINPDHPLDPGLGAQAIKIIKKDTENPQEKDTEGAATQAQSLLKTVEIRQCTSTTYTTA